MKRIACIGTVLLAMLAAGAEEKSINFSGFIDFTARKNFYPDNSYYQLIGLKKGLEMSLDHINLYSEFKPNDKNTALIELRYLHEPHGLKGSPGMITNVDLKTFAGGVSPFIHDTSYAVAPIDNTVSDNSTGGYLTWGGISIERAYYDYHFSQMANLRIGKYITPAGIWNVDHGSPVITTVQQPYMFSFSPMFPVSQVGLQGYGRTFLGDAELRYALTISSGRDVMPVNEPKDLAVGANVKFALNGLNIKAAGGIQLLNDAEIGLSGYSGKLKETVRYGITEFVVDPLSDASMTEQMGDGFANPGNKTYIDSVFVHQREMTVGGDLRFTLLKGLTLQGEMYYQRLNNYLATNTDSSLSHICGWYGLLSYKIRALPTLSVTPYFIYESITTLDAAHNPGNRFAGDPKFGGQVLDGFSTLSVGFNFNIYTYSTIKLEYSIVDAHMIGAFDKYQDAFDKSTFTTQFCLAF